MSGIPIIGKVFDAIMDSPILKAVVVAAAVWFTAGTATAYFAAPQAGIGAAMSTSASSMWTATTSFFGAEAGAAGLEGVAAETGAMAAEAGVAGAEGLGAVAAEGGAGVIGAAEPTLAPLGAGQTAGSMAGTQIPTAAAAAAPSGGGIVGKAFGWMTKNPMATMMIGQGIAGGSEAQAEEEKAAREKEEKQSRGLMGYKYGGDYGGVVGSQMTAPAAPVPTTAAAQQVVAGQEGQTVQQVPIAKENLPQLNEQGQIVPG